MKNFNMGDMGGIFKQAQEMQKKIQRVKDELRERVVEASSGGGMVKVQATGEQEVVSVRIAKDVVDPDDIEMLEDLVVAAVNAAVKKAKELNEAEMAKVTGGMNLGGLL